MDPIGSSPPPDFSNVTGSSSSTAATCADQADDVGNAAGDLATAVRDFLTGKVDGREVYQKAKEVSKQGGEAIDTCLLSDDGGEDPELQFIFPTPVYY
jgi:hypothetical protein